MGNKFVITSFSLEMPDMKAADEVDFLSSPGDSTVSEEAFGDVSPPKMKHSAKSQAVSGPGHA